MGQPLCCSAADGMREAMVMAPPPTHDSAALPCFHGYGAFLHRHFPPQSPPSHPLLLPLHSQQQPSPWDCSTIPELHLPATAPSRRPRGCGDWTPASVPPPAKGRSSPTNTPVFPPSCLSCRVLCGSMYSFPLVRHSCLFLDGVLYSLLCLKLYS